MLFVGKNDEAIAWVDSMVALAPDDKGVYYEKACVLSLMGRTTEAIDALKTAFEKGYRDFNRVANNRDLDAIKSLPAYTKLIEEYKQKQVLTLS